MSERVTDAEAIAWCEGELRMAESIRSTATHPGSKESSARMVARCTALLALARDGQRWREETTIKEAVLCDMCGSEIQRRLDDVRAGNFVTLEHLEASLPAPPATPSTEGEDNGEQ